MALFTGVLISVTNASMSAIVLPDVQTEFRVPDDTLSWFVAGFLIPFATGTLVYGRLADMFGTKRFLLAGVAIFSVSSFLVALAPSFEAAVAARVLQGMGATAIPALSMATIVHTTDDSTRGGAIGTIVVAVGVGFGAGPLLGGSLTELLGWPGPFWFTGAATTLLFLLMAKTVPSVPGAPGQRFDAVGAMLVSLAVTGGVIALNRMPNNALDPAGLTGALAIVPLFGLFALRTRRVDQPFVDPVVLRNGRFVALCVVGLCIQGSHFGVVVMLPLLLERYHDMRIIDIGLLLLPGALVLAVSGIVAGWLTRWISVRVLLITGTWVLFNGAALFVLVGAGWEPIGIAAIYAVVAAGYGTVNAVAITSATGQLPSERTGIGVGVFNIAFFIGGAITVALIGAILRLREDAVEGWIRIFDGAQVEFSDAGLVVLGLCTLGFTLAMLLGPEQRAGERGEIPRAGPLTGLVARQKPNKGGTP
jgi:MFS family permease